MVCAPLDLCRVCGHKHFNFFHRGMAVVQEGASVYHFGWLCQVAAENLLWEEEAV